MNRIHWPRDTIARRFALTIVLAALTTIGLNQIYFNVEGVLGLPPIGRPELLDQARIVTKLIEAASPPARPRLAASTGIKDFQVDWYADRSHVVPLSENAREVTFSPEAIQRFRGDTKWNVAFFESEGNIAAPSKKQHALTKPEKIFMVVELHDNSLVVFTAPRQNWELAHAKRIGIVLTLLIFSVVALSLIAARQLAKPIEQFSEAVRRFGADTRAPQMCEAGPQELRVAIKAFNAMQAQIQKFVADRTSMLMAISHDLRTPLTRMRLRGEFIEDAEQQTKLFRDVDEMHAMIDAALDFFRDDAETEQTTQFDLSELLRTIRDDYTDQGIDIPYYGPEHQVYLGRPMGLKRVFTNLIDNTVKYGTQSEIELTCLEKAISVAIKDRGPGIPSEFLQQVFTPFYRLEGSRSRKTGGVGLGLTVVRTVVHSHGGDIVLRNRDGGGLEAVITLPFSG
ncbi:sensor histidine kinase [Oryzomonas rubra]|uniref:histidine kinase n=1 Tax=Oryzomonas rubra TaxID=2509454 RepID=A0A5A9XS92_9BACT|nr:ATP-binding protein [Oryzomonas rubra]KAA0895118.1 HAMP domain-containing protein [Oryzomonas rubra]